MNVKQKRHQMILQIIRTESIQTQDELVAALGRQGLSVTQATISRDIKELRLYKAQGENGESSYAPPAAVRTEETGVHERLSRVLSESTVSVAYSDNLVVVRTLSGTANAAAEAIDSFAWEEVLGTLAGDNTILVVARTDAEAPLITERLRGFMR